MKPIVIAAATALVLSACVPAVRMTAPGSELPAHAFDVCQAQDPIGRCTKWAIGSGRVRPRDAQPKR